MKTNDDVVTLRFKPPDLSAGDIRRLKSRIKPASMKLAFKMLNALRDLNKWKVLKDGRIQVKVLRKDIEKGRSIRIKHNET